MRIFLVIFLWWSANTSVVLAQGASISLRHTPDGHLITSVHINGEGPFDFIVDTAASRTVISTDLAQQLSLPLLYDRTGRIMVASGIAETDVYQLDSLQFAGREWELGPALALPLPEIEKQQGYVGVLGLDVLASRIVLFDFDAQKLSLLTDAKARVQRRNPDWHTIKTRQNFAGFLSVNLRINKKTVRAIIDTGARRSIGNVKLGALLENLSPASIMTREQVVAGLVLSQVPARTGLARTVKLQSLRWHDAEILVTDLAVFQTLGLSERPALILGLDFLESTSEVMFDFSRERIWIKP